MRPPVAPAPPSQTGAPKRSSTYTVRVQVWGDLRDRASYDAIRGDFNAHPHRTSQSRTTTTPPGPAYYDALATQLAAGNRADLASFQGWMWQEYAGKGALQAVDELASRDKWSTPWPRTRPTTCRPVPGQALRLPRPAGTMLMYYVKEYFDRAGIAYPREGWTYTEFQDLCRRLTRQLDGKQVYAYQWNGGYLRNTPWWRMNTTWSGTASRSRRRPSGTPAR